MKTFEIQYVLRLEQQKEYYAEYVFAKTEKKALEIFSKHKGISDYKLLFTDFFNWFEGSWYCTFKCINEIKSEIEYPNYN